MNNDAKLVSLVPSWLCVCVWGGYLRAYDEQNEEILCFKNYVVKSQGHFELKNTTFRSGMDQ